MDTTEKSKYECLKGWGSERRSELCPIHGYYPEDMLECPDCRKIDRDIDRWKEGV